MAQFRDLEDGEVVEVQGSAAKPYEIKNTGGVYSCTCPAWRNQSRTIEARSCKHIRGIRGEAAELARVGEAAAAPRKVAGETQAAPVLLAQKWEPHVDITGWWLSEKLDGVRAYWSGGEMFSRLGNRFFPPEWFIKELGSEPLDGELWVGRGAFQETVGIVRRGDMSEAWRQVKFLVFDCPDHGSVFESRIDWLRDNYVERAEHVVVVDHTECRGIDHVTEELARVEGLGGEGLMARKPGSTYVAGRSSTLLKIKSFLDDEAVVVGHVPGAGRHKGRLGSLEAQLRSGVRFNVGTGLSDKQREDPPPIGAIINVRYQELTRDGVPRFPSFCGVRHDVAFDAGAEAPKGTGAGAEATRSTGAKPKAARPVKARPAKAAAASATVAAAATTSTAGARRFEFRDDKSSKFWEVSVEGSTYTVRYGRIGSSGTAKTKELASGDAAAAAAEKLIGQKTRKGYVEV